MVRGIQGTSSPGFQWLVYAESSKKTSDWDLYHSLGIRYRSFSCFVTLYVGFSVLGPQTLILHSNVSRRPHLQSLQKLVSSLSWGYRAMRGGRERSQLQPSLEAGTERGKWETFSNAFGRFTWRCEEIVFCFLLSAIIFHFCLADTSNLRK